MLKSILTESHPCVKCSGGNNGGGGGGGGGGGSARTTKEHPRLVLIRFFWSRQGRAVEEINCGL